MAHATSHEPSEMFRQAIGPRDALRGRMVRTFSILVFLNALASIACGANDNEATDDAGSTSVPPGATLPADGAPGVCCPASFGTSWAITGGYLADGQCHSSKDIDNICNARVEADEHGCSIVRRDACPPRCMAGCAPEKDGGPSQDAAADGSNSDATPDQ